MKYMWLGRLQFHTQDAFGESLDYSPTIFAIDSQKVCFQRAVEKLYNNTAFS